MEVDEAQSSSASVLLVADKSIPKVEAAVDGILDTTGEDIWGVTDIT